MPGLSLKCCKYESGLGIGDDSTADFETLEKLDKLLKTIGYISLFILAIHGQNPRLTEKHQEVLRWITRYDVTL